jgi:hypothetical protein
MTNLNVVNDNESMPIVSMAVESKQRPEIKQYTVPFHRDIEAHFIGSVEVYAANEAEAVAKVQAQIDSETLNEDIDMEDFNSCLTMSFSDVAGFDGDSVAIDESDIEENTLDEVDLADALQCDINQLHALISWDTEKPTKEKAFLEALAETQVAAV